MTVSGSDKSFKSKLLSTFVGRMRKDRQFSLPGDITDSRRILFVDSGDETDLLFATPVINWFHDQYPHIKSTLLVIGKDAEIAKSILKINTLITYEKKQMKLFKADYLALVRKLKGQKIDTLFLLSPRMSLERQVLALACGAVTRIGFSHPGSFPFINCEIKTREGRYEGDRMFGLLDCLGLRGAGIKRRIQIPESDSLHSRQLIHFRKPEKGRITVGIDPGRSKSRHNVIPEILAYLANNLAGRRKVKFLILTNPWDEKLINKFSLDLKSEIIDLIPTNPGETLSLLAQCDLFLSGNTNLFHFAVALNVPTVGIFTKYDGREWIPDHIANVKIFKGTKGERLSLGNFFTLVDEVLAVRDKVPL
ncbi:MAG: glycosyltransferase family 9 protein [Candidatus Krumholzibacteriota bacterium]|nr:glycosyltransferase family 9 protein [Candidatus Krumholzibacteriota bacterium]